MATKRAFPEAAGRYQWALTLEAKTESTVTLRSEALGLYGGTW